MNKVNVRRLIKLADHLKRVPRQRFNMAFWGEGVIGGSYPKCGFAGCAMGHAAFIPLFRRLGLRLVQTISAAQAYDGKAEFEPRIERRGGMRAAMWLFSIDSGQATQLFGSQDASGEDREETPQQVAKRIRQFVKDLPR